MRILIVEDEHGLAGGLQGLLEKKGYAVDAVDTGVSGLDYALSRIYDLIILDIMLPEKDGLTVLRELRDNRVDTPVLLLTAKCDVRDRALARRKERPLEEENPSFGDLVLLRDRMELCRGDERVRLGPKEFQIMECLMGRKQKVVDRQFLCEKVWGMLSEAEYNNVEVYITFLRRKLRSLHSNVAIRSLRSVGYYLEVTEP